MYVVAHAIGAQLLYIRAVWHACVLVQLKLGPRVLVVAGATTH